MTTSPNSFETLIYYSGIGADEKNIFTEQEFVNMMRDLYINKDLCKEKDLDYSIEYVRRDKPTVVLPEGYKTFTVDDWLDYSGGMKYPDYIDYITSEIFE
jgi:hypothetical protein